MLRSWVREDLPLFAAMNRDVRVMRYFPALMTDSQTEMFYNRIVAEFKQKGWGL
ncbi:GNAT family N-acetyltransferase, partial [Salmonella enterica]|uniref:GNAT family N-acetyltransferase n=1 Tax=Salmonella enterica TaxID=28901 RepID=UPI0030B332DB